MDRGPVLKRCRGGHQDKADSIHNKGASPTLRYRLLVGWPNPPTAANCRHAAFENAFMATRGHCTTGDADQSMTYALMNMKSDLI